jgi:predicted adenylyl cyclase CyaB
MSRNVELKARLADIDAARRTAAASGARLDSVVRQTDTYFTVPSGRLKLRESAPGGAELIFYHRPDTTADKVSEYRRVPVANPTALAGLLAMALGVRARVVKEREVWLSDNVRIHLDRVDGLGTFLEFEVVVGPNHPEPECVREAARLASAFGVAESDRVACSYVDLTEGGPLRLTGLQRPLESPVTESKFGA